MAQSLNKQSVSYKKYSLKRGLYVDCIWSVATSGDFNYS